MKLSRYEVLVPVSRRYPSVWGRLPTRYSPVRRFHFFHSTEVSFQKITLDLHVLGTPPAFILSQDQTLYKSCIMNRRSGIIILLRNKRVLCVIYCFKEFSYDPFNCLNDTLYIVIFIDFIFALWSFQGTLKGWNFNLSGLSFDVAVFPSADITISNRVVLVNTFFHLF